MKIEITKRRKQEQKKGKGIENITIEEYKREKKKKLNRTDLDKRREEIKKGK